MTHRPTDQATSGAPFPGFLFTLWLAPAAASHLFLEAYRGDSVVVPDAISQAQLAALLVMLLAL